AQAAVEHGPLVPERKPAGCEAERELSQPPGRPGVADRDVRMDRRLRQSAQARGVHPQGAGTRNVGGVEVKRGAIGNDLGGRARSREEQKLERQEHADGPTVRPSDANYATPPRWYGPPCSTGLPTPAPAHQ